MGEEPVGRPRTKGCSLVGPKAIILSTGALEKWPSAGRRHTNYVLGNIATCRVWSFSDDESHIE